jgi:hypothetical protein
MLANHWGKSGYGKYLTELIGPVAAGHAIARGG